MVCPSCGSSDVARVRRVSILDQVLKWFGSWPYRCRACHRKSRFKTRRPATAQSTAGKTWQPASPFRPSGQQPPTASIVVSAESNEELTEMLTALNSAIVSYHDARQNSRNLLKVQQGVTAR